MERDWQRLDLEEDDWERELNRLGEASGDKVVFFRVIFPSGMRLDAGGFQPLVERKVIHIRLQPQSPSYSENDELRISLPTEELTGHRQKAVRPDGEICLSVGGYIGRTTHVAMEIHLSASRDFLETVSGEFQEQ
jgi:hypothetical protein